MVCQIVGKSALASALIAFPHELFNVVGHGGLLEACWFDFEGCYVLGPAALMQVNFLKFH